MRLPHRLYIVLHQRWFAYSGDTRGIVMITIDNLIVSVMMVLIKLLGDQFAPIELVFFRSLFGVILLVPLMIQLRVVALKTKRFPMHVLRVVCSVGSMYCMFWSLSVLPIAEATAMAFTRPLIMTLFAVLFLGEVVRWRRWTAVGVGFLGVLVMARPDNPALAPMMLVALASNAFACASSVVVKKLTATETTVALMYYSAIGMFAFTALPAYLAWSPPSMVDMGTIAAIGILGVLGQFCFLRAYTDGRASMLAPFDYSRLLFATVLGFVLFGDLPSIWTVIGATIIAASTLYITYREAALNRATPKAPDATKL